MTQETWSAVDAYFEDRLGAADAALTAALAASEAAGLPAIAVSPLYGKTLNLLAKAVGARSVLEIGTLGGYSTIWLARALGAGGRLTTLEIDAKHAAIARTNVDGAGVGDRVEILIGAALDLMARLNGPFDFFFIDADKESNADYVAGALRLASPGALIIVDNVARRGDVARAGASAQADGVRRMLDYIRSEPRLEAAALQTVGAKGHDGFLLARVVR